MQSRLKSLKQHRLAKSERGLTLVGLILVGVLLVLVSILGMKVAPVVLEYYTVLEDVKATAHDPRLIQAGAAEIRAAYVKRMQISGATAITGADLEIGREGGQLAISFAYDKKVHLFRNVSLLFEFEGSSTD